MFVLFLYIIGTTETNNMAKQLSQWNVYLLLTLVRSKHSAVIVGLQIYLCAYTCAGSWIQVYEQEQYQLFSGLFVTASFGGERGF
jgi:hypothetical protein